MQKKKIANDSEIKKIYRLANVKDLEKFEEVRDDVVFAAKRIEIRVRKGVKKAAERLRREEQ